MQALGLISGTSMDGVDIALLETYGITVQKFGPSMTVSYSDQLRQHLQQLVAHHQHEMQDHLLLEKQVTEFHAAVVEQFMNQYHLATENIDVIGFHGQTIIHRPDEYITWQLGNGGLLANSTGIDVVCDFRRSDMSRGGQGAPLLPVYHQALFHDQPSPTVIVNIGGVSNVTYLGEQESLLAFDTGPGNAFIDDLVLKHTGKPYDAGGLIAQSGHIHHERIEQALQQPYYDQQPPKSLDRYSFSVDQLVKDLSFEDAVATLTYYTAKTIAESNRFFDQEPQQWIIAGGGRHNKTIMSLLNELVSGSVVPIDQFNIDGDCLEAQGFAFMAVRSLQGLPISFPGTTGVQSPLTGGAFYSSNRTNNKVALRRLA